MNIMFTHKILLAMLLSIAALTTKAEAPGLDFYHEDWQIVCDNTRTCRVAGYNKDGDEGTVSLLLTRRAGPSEPFSGKLRLGSYLDDDLAIKLPQDAKLSMRINGNDIGFVQVDKNSLIANLSSKQIKALLTAISQKAHIEWVAAKHTWRLSDQGATEVLLKMDEFQERVNTIGAIIKKGTLNEDKVLTPLPIPVITTVPILKTKPVFVTAEQKTFCEKPCNPQ